MDKQNLIIFKQDKLYEIIKELEKNLNFNIFNVSAENDLENKLANLSNYLIITQKKLIGKNNQFLFNKTPVKLLKLIEKINIQFLKLQFNSQSSVKVNNYTINLNSREMLINSTKLKLTEKEINTIIYLSKSNKPVSINELQKKVWSYQSDMETHTVETHIYRLRKKILSAFNDEEFIISKKNGYQIK